MVAHDPPTPPPCADALRRTLARVCGRAADATDTAAAVRELLEARVLDRVSARAAALAAAGRFDRRDLRELLPPRPVTAPAEPAAADAGPPLPAFAAGTAVGPCVVGPVLHDGRHGRVYAATHVALGRPVVVKVAAADRLAAEAAALAAVTHPNVIRLWDAGRHDGQPFLVLDRHGDSLAAVAARGRVGVGRALRFGRDAARGLRAARRAGFVHGDIKPGNLLLTADGSLTVADFGLARRADAAPTGVVAGSWPYLAPECFDGGGDHRADVYALGLTLYHLLAGAPPVTGATFEACRAAHRKLVLEPLHWWLPGVSRAASAAVLKMAARDPDARFAGPDDVLAELTRLRAARLRSRR